jgi:hypothetical protein
MEAPSMPVLIPDKYREGQRAYADGNFRSLVERSGNDSEAEMFSLFMGFFDGLSTSIRRIETYIITERNRRS